MPNLIQLLIEVLGGKKAESDIQAVSGATEKIGAESAAAVAGAAALGGAIGALVGEMAGRIIDEFAQKLTELGESMLLSGVHLAEEVEQLHNLSLQSGVSINDLRVFKQVMVEAGLPTETLTFALSMLSRRLAEGDKGLISLVGDARTSTEALFRLSEAVAHGGNAADIAFKAFGRGGIALIPVLTDLAPRVTDVRARLGDLSEETIAGAEKWTTFTHQLDTRTKSFLAGTGAEFLRWFSDIHDALTTLPDLSLKQITSTAKGTGADVIGGAEVTAKRRAADLNSAITPEFLKANFAVAQTNEQMNALWEKTKQLKEEAKKAAEALAAMMKRPEQEPGAGKEWYDHLIKQQEEAKKAQEKFVKEASQRFRAAHADMATFIESAASGLANSIETVFVNLTTKFQTFGSAIRTLFDGLAQSVLSALAKIATSKLLLWIATSFLGGTTGGFGGILGAIAGDLIGRSGGSSMGAARGGDTYIVNAMDARSLVEQIRSPSGSWNRAQHRLAIGTSY